MKKISAILIALMLLVSFMFVMTSCNGKDEDVNEGGEQNGDNTAGEGGDNSGNQGDNTACISINTFKRSLMHYLLMSVQEGLADYCFTGLPSTV